ncbi:Cocaine esterase [Durusdinium trenchii]|uniref:Cocaine esterase n=1 Tax=Durusdinium trenchii TaxID=1381693 RepID=A0ABP0PR06_9DINO
MLKLHFSVTEDEATLLTVMTTGLATEVEVPRGKDVGFAKNRAIDKLWPSIPFCHAVAALSNLRIFDDQGEELNDGDACSALSEGQHLRLSAAPPGPRGVSAGPVSAGAQVFASTVSAVGRHKLGLDAAGPDSREELMKLPLKELKARLAASGLSAEGCLEKADLVFEHPTTADDSGLAACAPVPQVETQQKKVGAFNALFAVGALLGLKKWESGRFLPALGDSESGAVLAEFVSGTRKVPIETFFIDSRSAAFLQAAPEGKQLCEKIHFLGGLGVRELHGLRVAYLSGCPPPPAARGGRAVQRPTAASRSSFMGTAGLAMGPVLLLSGDIVTLGAGRGGDGTPLGSVRAPHGLGLWKRLTSRRGRMGRAASASDLGVDITQEEVELTSHYGRLELIALTPAAVRRAERVPTVLVNVGCYYTLADTLVAVEGPRYVAQGYAYVLWRASGPLEEVADLVFQRWRADAAVVLDWLGQQSWCDGRVGCHGYSLLGNTSYATLAASHAPDAPAERPLVRAAVPAISFSRIQPTVFVRGQSLAAELALCFLWLAEKGASHRLQLHLEHAAWGEMLAQRTGSKGLWACWMDIILDILRTLGMPKKQAENMAKDPCNAPGLTCNFNGAVYAVYLDGHDLRGHLPQQLNQLHSLWILWYVRLALWHGGFQLSTWPKRPSSHATALAKASAQKRLLRVVAWVCWFVIVFIFSLPSILFAFSQSLPAHNLLPVSDLVLQWFNSLAPYLNVLIDMVFSAPVSAKYAAATGIKADRLLMTFRLFSAWFVALLTTFALDENCLSGWKWTWTVCQPGSANHQNFNWEVFGEEILNTDKDICGSSDSWWSDGRCSRAIVGNLTPFLLKKLMVRATVQPLMQLLLWHFSTLDEERGSCQGRHLKLFGQRMTGSLEPLQQLFGFFGLPDWPGLAAALAQRPVDRADVDMWGRANTLWQGGQFARDELESFWKDGRDRQFNFDSFRGTHPPHIHIIAGWNDMFLQQGLDDFVSACRLTEARLTIYTGGHFGLITKHAGEVAAETGRCYREHLGGDMLDHRSPVRMQLITTTDETEWLECETWPPPCDSYLDYFLLGEGATGRLAEEAGSCRLSYTYDPKDPTPYAGDGWLNLQKDGAQDQRGLESSRTKDLLLASSQALEKDVDLAGEVQVSLSLRCSAPQCDVVARLCVVRGAGGAGGAEGVLGWLGDLADPRQLGAGQSVNLCENIVRAEFQKDEATRLDFRVGFTACRLNAGDRVRLHLCSAAHPRWLRHPLQPKGEDWLLGDSQVGPPAVISVETPSRLRLPLRSAELRSVFLTSP